MRFLPFFASAVIGGVLGYALAQHRNQKIMKLTKATLLQAIALIAAAQATAQSERVKSAELANRVAEFKQDHDLVNDEEVSTALGAVLRAAETAPVSADATTAQTQTAKFLDENADGKDDSTGKTAAEIDAENAKAGASGNSGLAGTANGGAGAGSGSKPPKSNEDLVTELVDGNSKEDLLALAEQEGVQVSDSDTKPVIAAAIVEKRNAQA